MSVSLDMPVTQKAVLDKSSIRRVVVSSWIGNTIEYYDFLLYGLASALVFSKVFFPNVSPLTAMLASFATFGVGFVARPLGGVFFGHMGDTLGRKITLLITLGGMGAATFLIGCLPSYNSIGIWAPILLVVLRFVQGFLVGGEWGGAMLMVVESAPANRRGLLGSIPQTGGFSGQLLATGIFALVTQLPEEQLLSWGWRIPFMLSVVLVLVGMYMRRRLDETPVFQEVQRQQKLNPKKVVQKEESPVITVVRDQWRSILLIMVLRFAESVPFFMTTVFAVSYATTQLGVDKQTMLNVIMSTCVLAFPMHMLFGALSDKVGRRPVYIFGALFAAAMAFPFFWLLESGSFVLMVLGYILLINIAHNSINAVQPSFFTELFGPKVRYSGASIGAQLGAIVAGGFTPFIAKGLTAIDNNDWTLVACYVVIAALVAAYAAWRAPETSRRDLTKDTL
ncbi:MULTISPECIES: MFS transporter [Serratia]|jgi:MHS family shikimate/dehydroshikimate transporter-like MFS transporter|uniref:MFS transporter n=1 Tax=Serratia fonticola TaxID=47917 RepID=A0A1Q5VJ88_SERFO|nr:MULTISPECIES: MFS transporter [Serratia]MBE0152757.1 MHS family MFS transporter [Serratia fonticola]MDQ7208838.1 MFS transporter [Serratia fonticola]MDQ9128625.1 MFS transporter [Serratia fonticola]OKP30885.1 MFS transporter [Serratia fonticola]QKJ58437.1 MHS family MFS transporter [Serratia fonticola]